jgi:C4-dicarboxylate transporter DctM subunit
VLRLFVVILAVVLIGFYALEIDLSVIAIEIFRLADTPQLVALPLFTFTG